MKMLVRNLPQGERISDRSEMEIFGYATLSWPGILWTNIRVPKPAFATNMNVGHLAEDLVCRGL